MTTKSLQPLEVESTRPLLDWVRQHPIATYLAVTLLLSYSIWSLLFLVIEPGGMVHDTPPIAFVIATAGLLGPTLGSLLTTYGVYGRDGLRQLGARLRNRHVGRWWFAVLIIPAVTALTPVLRWATGHPVDTATMLGSLVPGIVVGLVAGFMEELGWRGFLLPHMLKKYSPLTGTLLLGIIWGGVWHGYADYFGLGDKGWAAVLLIALLGPVLLTAWSLIITWVYENTQGSLLLSIFMHASISSSALIFGQKYTTTGEEIAWTAISVGLACLAAALIWLFVRRPDINAGERPKTIR